LTTAAAFGGTLLIILSLGRHLRYMHPRFRDPAMAALTSPYQAIRKYSRLTDNIIWAIGIRSGSLPATVCFKIIGFDW
jgi:hypothetical protein